MYDLVPLLSSILPIIACSLLILVISINLYFKIRRKFPIKVNCWFCNSWTKVPYDDRNSFDCPTCSQYNGFTKDGDYNKIIPEQHDEFMNRSTRMKCNKTVSNGLCAFCNNNQQLKIFQLAHFVPLVEENYDVEIEHFQKQLEKAYKLCKKCDRVLKKTIEKQNAWIFGNKIKSLCFNGISKIANQIKKETKLSFLAKLNGILSIVFVMGVVFTTISSNKFFTKKLQTYVPTGYLPIFKSIISAANASKVFEFNHFAPYFSKTIKIEPYLVICVMGFVLQILKIIFGEHITATKINRLLCWKILLLISWVRFNRNYTNYILFFEAFCCIYLISTSFTNEDKKVAQKPTGKSMRKIVKNLEYTCSDITESDFENISSSSKNSSGYLNVPPQSTASNLLNSSFMTAKSTPSFDSELNKSLNNLHLGLGFKSPSSISSFAVKRPKPVLSPPKLQTANSWLAGGFWRDADGVLMPMAQKTNLSRSSSESSGFGSQHNEPFAPKSNHFGEITADFQRLSPCLFSPTDFRRNTFYPNLQQNNMLLIQRVGSPGLVQFHEPYQRKGLFENWSDKINSQATQGFRDLSLCSNN